MADTARRAGAEVAGRGRAGLEQERGEHGSRGTVVHRARVSEATQIAWPKIESHGALFCHRREGAATGSQRGYDGPKSAVPWGRAFVPTKARAPRAPRAPRCREAARRVEGPSSARLTKIPRAESLVEAVLLLMRRRVRPLVQRVGRVQTDRQPAGRVGVRRHATRPATVGDLAAIEGRHLGLRGLLLDSAPEHRDVAVGDDRHGRAAARDLGAQRERLEDRLPAARQRRRPVVPGLGALRSGRASGGRRPGRSREGGRLVELEPFLLALLRTLRQLGVVTGGRRESGSSRAGEVDDGRRRLRRRVHDLDGRSHRRGGRRGSPRTSASPPPATGT